MYLRWRPRDELASLGDAGVHAWLAALWREKDVALATPFDDAELVPLVPRQCTVRWGYCAVAMVQCAALLAAVRGPPGVGGTLAAVYLSCIAVFVIALRCAAAPKQPRPGHSAGVAAGAVGEEGGRLLAAVKAAPVLGNEYGAMPHPP